MLELVFQHLQPCMHLMLTQRPLLHDFDPYCRNVDKFLLLIPACCCYEQSNESNVDHSKLPDTVNCWQLKDSLYGNYHAYLCDARNKIAACKVACSSWVNRYDGCDGHRASAPCDDLSLSGSSGYESFKCRLDLGPELADVPIWQSSISDSPSMHCALRHNSLVPIQDTSPSSSVGLFLDTLFDLLQTMLNNNVYVNIHLTGLFSRLAIYSQPLLRTYLLNQKLVLQPNVRSLFQVSFLIFIFTSS